MMKGRRVKLGDMSTIDRKEYDYHTRVMRDLNIKGARWTKDTAELQIKRIEDKYSTT